MFCMVLEREIYEKYFVNCSVYTHHLLFRCDDQWESRRERQTPKGSENILVERSKIMMEEVHLILEHFCCGKAVNERCLASFSCGMQAVEHLD